MFSSRCTAVSGWRRTRYEMKMRLLGSDLVAAARRAAAIALLALTVPAAGAQTSNAKIVLAGSATISGLMTDVARRFEAAHPGFAIEMRPMGTGKGLAELRSQTADIAMVSRPLVETERNLFSYPLCRDGAAIIVHRTNTVKGLTSHQLSDILTGAVTDWKQLGGRPGTIKVAWLTPDQAIPELLVQQLKLTAKEIRPYSTHTRIAEALKFVASDPNAITAVPLGLGERSVKSGVPVKLLAYEGVAASTRTVRDRTYALSRPLLLVTRTVPTGAHKQFVDYAVSAAVNDLHEKHGFVPYQD